jgi:hypothetical protein
MSSRDPPLLPPHWSHTERMWRVGKEGGREQPSPSQPQRLLNEVCKGNADPSGFSFPNSTLLWRLRAGQEARCLCWLGPAQFLRVLSCVCRVWDLTGSPPWAPPGP